MLSNLQYTFSTSCFNFSSSAATSKCVFSIPLNLKHTHNTMHFHTLYLQTTVCVYYSNVYVTPRTLFFWRICCSVPVCMSQSSPSAGSANTHTHTHIGTSTTHNAPHLHRYIHSGCIGIVILYSYCSYTTFSCLSLLSSLRRSSCFFCRSLYLPSNSPSSR